jgi:hypothetical protein
MRFDRMKINPVERLHNWKNGAPRRCSRATAIYRGFAKVELQNLSIGTACNIKRWWRRPKSILKSSWPRAALAGKKATNAASAGPRT